MIKTLDNIISKYGDIAIVVTVIAFIGYIVITK